MIIHFIAVQFNRKDTITNIRHQHTIKIVDSHCVGCQIPGSNVAGDAFYTSSPHAVIFTSLTGRSPAPVAAKRIGGRGAQDMTLIDE
jgi:hypothetical protein